LSFDGEGVPQQKTPLIEKGILRNFLYDNYAAKKEDKQSTGNASRAGYLSTPNVEANKLHVLPGTNTSDQIINEVDERLDNLLLARCPQQATRLAVNSRL